MKKFQGRAPRIFLTWAAVPGLGSGRTRSLGRPKQVVVEIDRYSEARSMSHYCTTALCIVSLLIQVHGPSSNVLKYSSGTGDLRLTAILLLTSNHPISHHGHPAAP